MAALEVLKGGGGYFARHQGPVREAACNLSLTRVRLRRRNARQVHWRQPLLLDAKHQKTELSLRDWCCQVQSSIGTSHEPRPSRIHPRLLDDRAEQASGNSRCTA